MLPRGKGGSRSTACSVSMGSDLSICHRPKESIRRNQSIEIKETDELSDNPTHGVAEERLGIVLRDSERGLLHLASSGGDGASAGAASAATSAVGFVSSTAFIPPHRAQETTEGFHLLRPPLPTRARWNRETSIKETGHCDRWGRFRVTLFI